MSALAEAALAYAKLGWPVFPLRPRDKVPLIPKARDGNGVHDAATGQARIESWWREHPDANIGLACGAHFWVLDADYAGFFAEQPDGADTTTALQKRFGYLPATVKQYTGGLGWQWLFAPDPRVKNSVKVLPGLDTRSTGGYVVAPPSIHPSGRTYRWLTTPDDTPIAAAPEWLIRLLEPVVEPAVAAPRAIRTGDLPRYATVALDRTCERITGCQPGNQADTLDHAAYSIGRLVGGGIIPRGEARAALVAAGSLMTSAAGRTRKPARSTGPGPDARSRGGSTGLSPPASAILEHRRAGHERACGLPRRAG
jgi:hypothetical protein